MFLRDTPQHTVGDLYDLIAPPTTTATVLTSRIDVDLTINNTIKYRDDEGHVSEILANGNGVLALGNWLNIPSQFLGRIDPDVQENLLNSLLIRQADATATLSITDRDGLMDVSAVNHMRVDPRNLIDIAAEVVGHDAEVVEYRRDAQGYAFDLIVSGSHGRAVGGDAHVGDLTRGGLRFGQDTKKGLAPWVQRYLYRLVCTNGMEIPDHGLKIDARGQNMESLLESLTEKAQDAFAKVTGDIDAFYSLRNIRIFNPERTLVRLAQEHGISARTLASLLEALPEYLDADGTATQFDIVNLITNAANADALTNRPGARRTLESIGGLITHDEAARCGHCASKLVL